ncbi:MAG: DUF4163 domain-containing protein [Desulfotomaculaceae bacterium]|nr:DUF4163 domain-containing protein [Desulfotomaculaceae bacterium]
MMKKICLAGIVVSLVLSMCAVGFAAVDSQSAIVLDGTKIEAAAYIDRSNVYLPLRTIGETLGYEIQWSETDKTISVSKPGGNIMIDLTNNLKITAGDHVYYADGDYKIIADRTYQGLGFFSINFGLEMRWDKQNNTIQLYSIHENAISIKTQKEASENEIIKINLQYPQIDGLADKTVQDSINSIFQEAALAARQEGLKNAVEMEMDRASGYGSPNKCETYFDYRLKYNQNGLLSVVFLNYQYTGGAHGLTVQSSRTFNLNTGAEYKLKDLMKADADYVSFVSANVRNEINERVKEGLLYENTPFQTIKDDHDFYLSNDAVVIYFQQYEHWPYAAGIQEFPVEFSVLSDMLKPEFSFLNDSIVVGDNYTLVERGTSGDRDYYLNHPSFNKMKHIVSFIETAEFKEYKDGELWFTARGGDDTGNYQFPYLLAYNPNTEELRREEPFLPLNEKEDIAFGKDGWKQTLNDIKIQDESVVFEFKPAAGEILAGGGRLPYTTVRYDERANELEFSFLNAEVGDSLKEIPIIESPGLKYVKEIVTEQIPGRPGNEQNPAQPPIVKARIALDGKPLYNAKASYLKEGIYEDIDICTVSFK